MRRIPQAVVTALLAATLGCASAPPAKTGNAGQAAATRKSDGFDVNALDRAVDPCADFYQFACGTWIKTNPIPGDQSRWGRFDELQERNQLILRDVLEKAAAKTEGRDAVEQKIGDYWASCMDEKAIEAKGIAPLKPELDAIAALKDKAELAPLLARLHRQHVNVLFDLSPEPEFKNAKMMGASVDQGGLGLPERDYYLREDPKSVELRKQYVDHVANMLKLAGATPEQAAKDAQAVMALETALAKISMDVVSRRYSQKLYNPKTRQELAALDPLFDWSKYLAAVGTPSFDKLNVDSLGFVSGMNAVVEKTPLEDLKVYLRWQALNTAASALSSDFVNEDFAFYGKALKGAKELKPRWKRCVESASRQLGEAVGQAFVKVAFPPEAKERVRKMVHELEAAMKTDVDGLDWMTPDTKKAAAAKLGMFEDKIGYPDKWRDYTKYQVVRDDYLGNTQRGGEFEKQRQLDKIGKPVDRSEWHYPPSTVNAYYDPQQNNINFMAGILQPPFFDNRLDDAVNYGAIGAVIGHEMTHGFDDEGRQFDGTGDLRDWWTEADGKAFEQHAQCLVDEYAGFTAVDDVKLNGKLTLGENTADNGGLRLALMALEETLKGKQPKAMDGFTPQQRLFLAFAQVWCQNITPQAARMRAQTDPHSPGQWRTNGVMRNLPEFRKAFSCKEGQPMAPATSCRVW